MKTIMIATDFSENSIHAARYGYALAQQLRADVVLCNAMTLQAELPQTGFVVWPSNQYDIMMDESGKELEKLKNELYKLKAAGAYTPHISCVTQGGMAAEVIEEVAAEYNADLIITGAHSPNFVTEFVIGDHTKRLADTITKPMLTIPVNFSIKEFKQIALALDLNNPAQDLAITLQVIALAKALDARVLLAHIYANGDMSAATRQALYDQLNNLAQKANYHKIDTIVIKAEKVNTGLGWLCENNNIQLLAMSHHLHGFFDSIIQVSYTKKMISHISIPLMVLPVANK
ncbi:hypothetical protein BEL04_06220 [Mucilaginibacter sp. PPCGB 2223]|uniref:universal stress protein n=1 Tax=Mucilaginibacter sp. PPCGB 2223 TaxID=1886027 RepID=UPI0008266BF2|nr:universal stress protein [Mucilaginibacter sp. PPCGB 2223]OCX53878.1 hypothetical protein BEL04_06220 [Mucilaginibacter sp. PPCGB 2223]